MRRWCRGSHSYAKTLNLPKSELPNRPDRALIEQRIKSSSQDLYTWQLDQDRPTKVFFDGPPYANGDLHLGHAMNKILKDIINRSNVLKGFKVKYVPGWDCHGLPIENASQVLAKKRKLPLDTTVAKRQHAKNLALDMIYKQMEGFKSFAVMTDWNTIYRTLDPEYVVRQLRVFASMMARNLVYRQRKPVYWSCESRTALAEGELQYEQVESQAIYVKYPVFEDGNHIGDAVIWTTTPWTIPCNRAICVASRVEYAFVEIDSDIVIVAKTLIGEVPGLENAKIIRTISGDDLAKLSYKCPLTGDVRPILVGSHVTDSSGTGLVHTAPGHGNEDYLVGVKEGLEIYCPVDGAGRYTEELGDTFAELRGQNARKIGTPRVMELLEAAGSLHYKHKVTHNVPFDWRSKTPVMIRSTPQSFVDLSDVRQMALDALENVKFNPESGKTRLASFIQSRTEWCVSRQRVWGVPIPMLFHKESEDVLMGPDVVNHIIDRIEKYGDEGIDKWFEEQSDISEWLPESLQHLASEYRKGTDTMDVWFDSGTAWTQGETPADYYLEGSDQHRGWFQSSLLTHVAMSQKPQAPFKNLITHGFTLDEEGAKMSKSLGNITGPTELINGNKRFKPLGVDGLRLFIAQTDYTTDVTLSPTVANQVASTIRKLRLTFKFLLGNLDGYVPQHQPELSPADKFSLGKLYEFVESVSKAYNENNFSRVIKLLNIHMNNHLSAFYFDISKDVLYTEKAEGSRRAGIQYVLAETLKVYLSVMCPITPLLCQEVWEYSPEYLTQGYATPIMAGWQQTQHFSDPELESDFKFIHGLKSAVNDVVESARNDKKLGSSLGCNVYLDGDHGDLLQRYLSFLPEYLIVSKVELGPPKHAEWSYQGVYENIKITVTNPTEHKCPRCWQFNASEEEQLCQRCDTIVNYCT